VRSLGWFYDFSIKITLLGIFGLKGVLNSNFRLFSFELKKTNFLK